MKLYTYAPVVKEGGPLKKTHTISCEKSLLLTQTVAVDNKFWKKIPSLEADTSHTSKPNSSFAQLEY